MTNEESIDQLYAGVSLHASYLKRLQEELLELGNRVAHLEKFNTRLNSLLPAEVKPNPYDQRGPGGL